VTSITKTLTSKRKNHSSTTSSVVVKWVFIFSSTSPSVTEKSVIQHRFMLLTRKRINMIELWEPWDQFFKATIMIRSFLSTVSVVGKKVQGKKHRTALLSTEISLTLKLLALRHVFKLTESLYLSKISTGQPISKICLSKWMATAMEKH